MANQIFITQSHILLAHVFEIQVSQKIPGNSTGELGPPSSLQLFSVVIIVLLDIILLAFIVEVFMAHFAFQLLFVFILPFFLVFNTFNGLRFLLVSVVFAFFFCFFRLLALLQFQAILCQIKIAETCFTVRCSTVMALHDREDGDHVTYLASQKLTDNALRPSLCFQN